MNSPLASGSNALSLAITADLLLTVPLVYFLLIRKSNIPKTTVIPVMMLGLLVGSIFLPKEGQTYLALFKTWALPLIELSVITFVILKVKATIKAYKQQKRESLDFYETLQKVAQQILPKKLVLPFTTEIAVFYYGFVNWRKRKLAVNEFSYHKKSTTPSLLIGFIMVILIEMVGLHFLLAKWSSVLAWVLTGLSFYTAIQVFAFIKSLSQRPVSINANSITLRYGIMGETQIPFSDIDSITLSQKELETDKLTKTLSPFGELESHNIILNLKRENTLVGLYGFKKQYTVLAFYLDEPESFRIELENALNN
jgi:hypothetical protein